MLATLKGVVERYALIGSILGKGLDLIRYVSEKNLYKDPQMAGHCAQPLAFSSDSHRDHPSL